MVGDLLGGDDDDEYYAQEEDYGAETANPNSKRVKDDVEDDFM